MNNPPKNLIVTDYQEVGGYNFSPEPFSGLVSSGQSCGPHQAIIKRLKAPSLDRDLATLADPKGPSEHALPSWLGGCTHFQWALLRTPLAPSTPPPLQAPQQLGQGSVPDDEPK